MKIKNKISAIVTIAIVLSGFIFSTTIVAQDNDNVTKSESISQSTAAIHSKSEVVYGKLSAEGSLRNLYVINHFEVEKGGLITDYGNYSAVQNLTDSNLISQNGNTISLKVEKGNFYYQGNMEATELPWIFEVTYELNGVKLSSNEMAGKSGKLGISIKTKANEKVNPTFFENYMLQITLSLDTDNCLNINAPDATIADAGQNKMLVFTVMPNKNADYIVTADINNFMMNGIEISAMPYTVSLELPDTNGILDEFNQLTQGVSQLNRGVGKLAEGTKELKIGANAIRNGSSEFKSGLTALNQNSVSIINASSMINSSLAMISQSLNGDSSDFDLNSLIQLPIVINELSKGLEGISGGLNDLKSSYAVSYAELDSAILNIPEMDITQEQINAQFPSANDEQLALLDQLYDSYTAGQAVKEKYEQVKSTLDTVVPIIETLNGNIENITESLDQINSNLGNSLSETEIELITNGLIELANNYQLFDQGLKEYMNGVGKLSSGYNQFDAGIYEFQMGINNLNNGVTELHGGTTTLNDEVSKIPDTLQKKIEELMDPYNGSDYKHISFVSENNKNTGLVQFVLKFEGIKLPEIKTVITEEKDQKETVIDRLFSLFK